MSRTVTVRRGEQLPENMAAPYVEVAILEQVIATLKPGDVLPPNCERGAITVEVHDDPPQAYLIVPCEPGKGTHDFGSISGLLHVSAGAQSADYRQVAIPLTLDDLRKLRNYTLGTRPTVIPPECVEAFKRLADTIAAWAAVPQVKEAGK